MSTSMGQLVSQGDWSAVASRFNEMEFVQRLGMVVDLSDPDRPRGDVNQIESYHLGGIGQDFVNGAVTSGVIDIVLGLTGLRFAEMGYFATRNLQIDLTLPVEKDGFYVTSRATSRIGKNLFAEATVFNPNGEPRVHATGVVRIGIRGSQPPNG
ncbi:MAG: PaaI family thioesterase [Congregibacter sp.]|nr:PaaI family thioesterase [Congregibacter sp.]